VNFDNDLIILSASFTCVMQGQLDGQVAGAAEGKETWGQHTPMASAGARTYNGGSRGQSPRWGVRGEAPLQLTRFLCLKQ